VCGRHARRPFWAFSGNADALNQPVVKQAKAGTLPAEIQLKVLHSIKVSLPFFGQIFGTLLSLCELYCL
jgi:hypothetical protein